MNSFVLLSFIICAVVFLIIAIPFLLLVSWAVNKWLLKGKLRLLYRLLFSFGIPVILVGLLFLYLYYAPYSTSSMNERLTKLVPEISLPPYKIVEYSGMFVGGDDYKETYVIKFNNGRDESLKSKLDSLSISNPKWKKTNLEYVYDTVSWENEVIDSIIIRPLDGTAVFVNYKW